MVICISYKMCIKIQRLYDFMPIPTELFADNGQVGISYVSAYIPTDKFKLYN